jgi:hypothetical protein
MIKGNKTIKLSNSALRLIFGVYIHNIRVSYWSKNIKDFDITSLADIKHSAFECLNRQKMKYWTVNCIFFNETMSRLNFGLDQLYQFQNAYITLHTWYTYEANRRRLRNINNNINRSRFSCIFKRCVMLPQFEEKCIKVLNVRPTLK